MREFLKGLELEKETIDTIMAEYGKLVTEDKEKVKSLENEKVDLKDKVKTYEVKIEELEKLSGDSEKIQEELEKLKKSMEEETNKKKMEEEDKTLTSKIIEVIGEKEFVNDYTKKSIINEIKSAIGNDDNKGKSYKDIFEELTKDKEGIFANPHQPKDMDDMNQNISTNVTKEAFDKMGYQDRLTLKRENPDLYQSFIK